MFGWTGGYELLIVGVIAILLFGKRLPGIARSLGKSLTEFKRGMSDVHSQLEEGMNEGDGQGGATPPPPSAAAPKQQAPTADSNTPQQQDTTSGAA